MKIRGICVFGFSQNVGVSRFFGFGVFIKLERLVKVISKIFGACVVENSCRRVIRNAAQNTRFKAVSAFIENSIW